MSLHDVMLLYGTCCIYAFYFAHNEAPFVPINEIIPIVTLNTKQLENFK